MSDAPLMLSVSGLRGLIGKSLTPEVCSAIRICVRAVAQSRKRKRRAALLCPPTSWLDAIQGPRAPFGDRDGCCVRDFCPWAAR